MIWGADSCAHRTQYVQLNKWTYPKAINRKYLKTMPEG